MNTDRIEIDQTDLRKLLTAANGDAALLYLYLRCGNDPAGAGQALQMPQSRYSCAVAALRQLGADCTLQWCSFESTTGVFSMELLALFATEKAQ